MRLKCKLIFAQTLSGSGEMQVDDEKRQVVSGDATWIPTGSRHSLLNTGEENCIILVTASSAWM